MQLRGVDPPFDEVKQEVNALGAAVEAAQDALRKDNPRIFLLMKCELLQEVVEFTRQRKAANIN